jgi:hypothetical protein
MPQIICWIYPQPTFPTSCKFNLNTFNTPFYIPPTFSTSTSATPPTSLTSIIIILLSISPLLLSIFCVLLKLIYEHCPRATGSWYSLLLRPIRWRVTNYTQVSLISSSCIYVSVLVLILLLLPPFPLVLFLVLLTLPLLSIFNQILSGIFWLCWQIFLHHNSLRQLLGQVLLSLWDHCLLGRSQSCLLFAWPVIFALLSLFLYSNSILRFLRRAYKINKRSFFGDSSY